MPTQTEIRERITNEIVNALKSNSLPPWRKPWQCDPNSGFPCNVITKRKYSGVNPLLLDIASRRHGFHSRYWATFRQWQQMGGQVKRRPTDVPSGRWGTNIVFCRPVTKRATDEGDDKESKFFVMRTYTVFNIDQVDGQFNHLRVGSKSILADEIEHRYEAAEEVIAATGADIRFGGDHAFCDLAGDYIQMPHRNEFKLLPDYYQTLFHELCHWTEHPSRLAWNRDRSENTYPLGELIAELGGVYMAGELELPNSDNLGNHASYLKHWLTAMQSDSRFIFKAAAQASRAVDFLLSFSRQGQPAVEVEEPAIA